MTGLMQPAGCLTDLPVLVIMCCAQRPRDTYLGSSCLQTKSSLSTHCRQRQSKKTSQPWVVWQRQTSEHQAQLGPPAVSSHPHNPLHQALLLMVLLQPQACLMHSKLPTRQELSGLHCVLSPRACLRSLCAFLCNSRRTTICKCCHQIALRSETCSDVEASHCCVYVLPHELH